MLCPFCREEIADGAIKCKHCGEILDKERHDALRDPQRGQSALNANSKSLIVEPRQTSDSPEKISVFPGQMKTDNKTGGGMPSSTLAFIIAATPIISALFIVAYDSVFSTNENALEKISWIPFAVGAIAMVLNYLLIVADVERMKKADVPFEFNMSWIILTPIYLFKRALALKQKYKNSTFVNTNGIAAFSLLTIALAVWYPLASLSNADMLSTKKSVIENYASRNIVLKDVKFVRDSFNTAVGWLTIGPNNMIEMTAKCRVNKTAFSSQLLWECDDAKNVALTPEALAILNPNAVTSLSNPAIADDLSSKKPNREVIDLIGNFNLFAKQCVEGNSSSPETRKSCEAMETTYSKIERLGWCPESDKVPFGTMRWVACSEPTNNPSISSSVPTQSQMQSAPITSLNSSATSEKPQGEALRFIAKWDTLNEQCRGGSGDSPMTQKACEARETTYSQIENLGWCWGPNDAIGAGKRWIACR